MFNSIKRKLGRGGVAGAAASADTPTSDVALPRRERRRSSIVRETKIAALKDLPMLKDTPLSKREAVFKQKLELCCVQFNFDTPTSNKRGKELKRLTLIELVDYIQSPGGSKIMTEPIISEVVKMVSCNVFRALPAQAEDFDPEEDEPAVCPAWPHLQLVYEFFLRFIVSGDVKSKLARKYVDQSFCIKLIEIFNTEDSRERDYLKTILHRMYGKFMSHRSFIRRSIRNVFYRFVYETERHNGIGEMLEVLGSIINGFALPLKEEHLVFLERALIPLHRPKCIQMYHQQLAYCVIQYVEKDPGTAVPIILGLLKGWPWSSSSKQVLLLNELEEILELTGPKELDLVITPLFKTLGKCISGFHFQVSERALFFFNNEQLLNHGCLSSAFTDRVMPLLFGPLCKCAEEHWNPTVKSLASNVMKHLKEVDSDLYDSLDAQYEVEQTARLAKDEEHRKMWEALEKAAGT